MWFIENEKFPFDAINEPFLLSIPDRIHLNIFFLESHDMFAFV